LLLEQNGNVVSNRIRAAAFKTLQGTSFRIECQWLLANWTNKIFDLDISHGKRILMQSSQFSVPSSQFVRAKFLFCFATENREPTENCVENGTAHEPSSSNGEKRRLAMYVVMGATGNTGSVVANRLLAKGQRVRAIGRSAERLRGLEAKGAEPFVGDITDSLALTKAFTGATAAYVMIPPDEKNPDPRAYQDRVTDAVATAVESSQLEYVVSLSSIGADKPEKTGPVVGLHHFEQRLNRIPGLNVLHLRAGYFMENTLAQIGLIQALGMAAGPLGPDVKLPMIATHDIGAFAAEELLRLDFDQPEWELLGQRDLTMTEAAAIIGRAIGKPGLTYRQVPDEQVRMAMTQMGFSTSMANLLLEMSAAINSGYMRSLEQRSSRNTTPTSYEAFVADEFVPRYESRPAAA
jgi:uncharacterized protein YbjT (DUF2867 family)